MRDFVGNELKLGDSVIVIDIERHGSQLKQAEIIKFCDATIKVRLTGQYDNNRQIARYSCSVAWQSSNPVREAELTKSKRAPASI